MEKLKNKDTVIFDLDGTLLDTVDDLLDSVNYALSSFDYPNKTKEEVRLAVGMGVSKLMARVLPNGGSDANFTEAINKFKEFYINIKKSKTKPYNGVIKLLEELKKRKYKIGVVSNKFDRACKIQCDEFFGNLIDFAQGEDEFAGIIRKPDPSGVYKVLEVLNSDIKSSFFVGDSEVDIQTAQNAKMPCISVLWGFKSKEFLIQNGAEIFVSDPFEILDLI